MPYDAAWGLAATIATGFFKYVHMDGDVLKRGSGQVRYMSFLAQYDERDYFE